MLQLQGKQSLIVCNLRSIDVVVQCAEALARVCRFPPGARYTTSYSNTNTAPGHLFAVTADVRWADLFNEIQTMRRADGCEQLSLMRAFRQYLVKSNLRPSPIFAQSFNELI